MKVLQCLVVDDEPLALQLLEDYISKTFFLELGYSTTNPLEALQKCEEINFDLVFLDIQMPEINGLDFLKILQQKTKIILTTAYSEFAVESYDYDVADYLLKPISYDRFYKSVQKIRNNFIMETGLPHKASMPKDYIFVKSGGEKIKIFLKDILFVEGLRDYVNITTENEEYIILETLKSLESELPENFQRIHKSFIINLDKISKMSVKFIQVSSGKEIPIGDAYRSNLRFI